MAQFASTTIPYSAGNQALTIKALEKRQADMLAQQAQQAGNITPENTQTPVQGVGHLANIMGDRFQLAQTEAKAAASKAELAKLISGYDPAAPNAMATVGQIGVHNPELAATLMQNFHERGQQRERFGQEDKSAERTIGANKDTATVLSERQAAEKRLEEKAREDAAIAAEQRLQARPTDEPLVVLKRALERGEINQQEFDERKKKLVAPSVQEQEKIVAHQTESVNTQSLLSKMDAAMELLDKGIHAGNFASQTQTIGENLPKFLQGTGYTPDPKVTENTRQYNSLMGEQVLAAVNAMKGASSDRDVQFNMKVANDPNASVEQKKNAIVKIKERLVALQAIQDKAVETYGEKPPVLQKLSSPNSAAAAAAPDTAAVREVPDEAAAKALPPNTRFKLPDGRTGTTR